MNSSSYRVLIIGAYGQFGRRIVEALARDKVFTLLVAGRDAQASNTLAVRLRAATTTQAAIESSSLDVEADTLVGSFAALRPNLVIHTAGPFQQRDYHVATAALNCGAHYIDLADGRAFVLGIERLDAEARRAGCWVVSGASSVPGLSAAVVDALCDRFSRLDSVESVISPGNRIARGLATTRAILSYVGQPFPVLQKGRWMTAHGWQSLRRVRVPGVGTRWAARCDVPDLAVLSARYPTLRTCDFRAGLELRRMHFGLWLASWPLRFGLLPSLAGWAPTLLRISESWLTLGSDTGLMQIELRGLDHEGRPLRLCWRIVAREGSGPQIPATAAVVLARKLARGALPGAGASACVGLFTLDEFLSELAGLPIEALLECLPG
jgi:hypothetical protein